MNKLRNVHGTCKTAKEKTRNV